MNVATKHKILYKSKRINYGIGIIIYISLTIFLFALLINLNISNFSTFKTRNSKIKTSILKEEKMLTDELIKSIKQDYQINDSIIRKISEVNHRNSELKIKKQIGVRVGYWFFLNIILLLLLFFILKKIYNVFYKLKISFYVTNEAIIINRFLKKEIIPFNTIKSIVLLDKIKSIGYLHNIEHSAIVIKKQNKDKDIHIIANKYSYSNLSLLLEVLKKQITNKLVIKKVKKDTKRDGSAFILKIIIGSYVLIKGILEYGLILFLIFGLLFTLSEILIYKTKKSNPCPELFE